VDVPKIALMVISDGRTAELARCLFSMARVTHHFTYVIHVDDANHQLGMNGALAEGWRQVRLTDAEYVFHLEQDFIVLDAPIGSMIELLDRYPYLTQVTLKRQPVNASEIAAGGIVEQDPDAFIERQDEWSTWTEHRKYWTTNPGVYRASLCQLGWPMVTESEEHFAAQLFRDPTVWSAIWGGKFYPPRIEHIGTERTGIGF
jgi:uncharacterized protein YbjT (DUF2867 family)